VGQRVSETINVAAPVATVLEVVTDLETYPDWVEGMLDAEVLTTDREGRPDTARFRVDAKVAEVTYTLRYAYEGNDVTWTLVEGEMVSQLDGSYVLTEQEHGTTVVYSIEADVDIPLPGYLKKRAVKQILEQGLDGLQARAEQRA
jgi:ribosome-associated toxin RatA of RatAB toxin-antitoxin module